MDYGLKEEMEALPRVASSRGWSEFCLLLRSSCDDRKVKRTYFYHQNLNEMVPLNLLTALFVSWAWAINLKNKCDRIRDCINNI